MVSADPLRVKLAARTLIEWRTPRESADYQRILGLLIEIHPTANVQLLLSRADILALDDDGTLLWYLSETLDSEPGLKSKRTVGRVTLQEIVNTAIQFVDDAAVTAIPGESDVARRTHVADALLGAIGSDVSKAVAYAAFVAIAVPLEPATRDRYLRTLTDTAPTSGPIQEFQRIFERILIVGILGVGILIELFLGLVAVILAPDGSTRTGLVVLAGLILIVLITAARRLRARRSKLSGAVNRLAVTRGIRIFKNSSIRDYPYDAGSDRDIEGGVNLALSTMCLTDVDVLAQVLCSRNRHRWGTLALANTPSAPCAVVRRVLQVMRRPEISPLDRQAIFMWLCTVQLVGAPTMALH